MDPPPPLCGPQPPDRFALSVSTQTAIKSRLQCARGWFGRFCLHGPQSLFRAVTIYITLVRSNLWRILQTIENKCETAKTAILTPSKALIIKELQITHWFSEVCPNLLYFIYFLLYIIAFLLEAKRKEKERKEKFYPRKRKHHAPQIA